MARSSHGFERIRQFIVAMKWDDLDADGVCRGL